MINNIKYWTLTQITEIVSPIRDAIYSYKLKFLRPRFLKVDFMHQTAFDYIVSPFKINCSDEDIIKSNADRY